MKEETETLVISILQIIVICGIIAVNIMILQGCGRDEPKEEIIATTKIKNIDFVTRDGFGGGTRRKIELENGMIIITPSSYHYEEMIVGDKVEVYKKVPHKNLQLRKVGEDEELDN